MYINKNIKETKRVFAMQDRYDKHRLDMNENPKGLPKWFVDKVLSEITPEYLATYPEQKKFIKKYSEYIGCAEENILVTNGTDRGIRSLLETFGEPRKAVVTVSPSFEMYRINCSLLGLLHKPVEYDEDLTIDVEKIISAIDEDTRIVVLLNPNNPVGNVYSTEEFERILLRAKAVDALLIVDEAYHYFYPESFYEYALKNENVVILRTFSKLFSIPALRLGAVIGSKEIIDILRSGQPTFDVNSIALLFGERLLEYPELIEELIETEALGKAFLKEKLKENGYDLISCKGNYLLIKTNLDPTLVEKKLAEEKILIHSYGNPLLKDYIRVTTGDKDSMDLFLKAFLRIDKKDQNVIK